MSNLYEIVSKLCEDKGISIYRLCKDIKIQPSVMTDIKMGRRQTVRADTASRLANYFDVTVDFLLGKETERKKDELPPLTKKDEHDIAKKLEQMLGELGSPDNALMFDGEPIDDETRELLRISLKNQLELSKRLAKLKFTPKKYRKK